MYEASSASTPRSAGRLDTDLNAVLIVANPRAGAGPAHAKIERLVSGLSRHGLVPQVEYKLAAVNGIAADLHAAGRLRAVVAAGGDGTVAEVINRTSAGVPLSVLPLGTENLLAKYMDMPRDPEGVAEVIAAGATTLHDAGSAAGRLFVLMASFGFDAEVVRRLHESRTGHIAHISYAKPIWEAIRTYTYPELRIYCDADASGDSASGRRKSKAESGGNGTAEVHFDSASSVNSNNTTSSYECLIRARFAFLTNVPRYAFGIRFAPQALGDDGWFDLCTFKQGSFFSGLWYLSQIILGRHGRLRDCGERRVRRLRIESDCPVPYELDGEASGYLPVEIEMLPNRLTLLAPPGWVARNAALLKSR